MSLSKCRSIRSAVVHSVLQFAVCLVAHTQPTHFGLGSSSAGRYSAANEHAKREVCCKQQEQAAVRTGTRPRQRQKTKQKNRETGKLTK